MQQSKKRCQIEFQTLTSMSGPVRTSDHHDAPSTTSSRYIQVRTISMLSSLSKPNQEIKWKTGRVEDTCIQCF